MKERAVALVSGGMDSLVSTAIAIRQYSVSFFHINYGQRTNKRELKAFQNIADYYKVDERMIIDMDHFTKIGGSSLTDKKIEIPEQINPLEIPNTYVPFRNANLLCSAVSWAEVIKATKIFIGATEEDSAGYPDCRREFYNAFNKVIKLGTKAANIEIITPIIDMNKSEIIKLGVQLNAPFDLTWSCYQNDDLACGVCDSCKRRLKAFQNVGMDDPIKYIEKLKD